MCAKFVLNGLVGAVIKDFCMGCQLLSARWICDVLERVSDARGPSSEVFNCSVWKAEIELSKGVCM